MELYDALFYRKSIKGYSSKVIKKPLLEEIKRLCGDITYLNNDLNIKAHLIERGHLIHFLIGKESEVKAPHYIIITSNKGEDYLQNVGFAIEKLVLELTCLGVGTTWIKCKLKKEDVEEKYVRDFLHCSMIDRNSEIVPIDKIMFIHKYGSKKSKKIAVDERLKMI
mgnify:CR=1 FL=1